MSLDEKTKTEYFLLKNYNDLSFFTRGLLLRIDFDSLERIAANNWFVIFKDDDPDKEKGIRMAQSMIQVDIISKIVMYVEDLIIIAESLRLGMAYYELLDEKTSPGNKDVGKIISDFLDNIDNFTNAEISKIMSYVDLDDPDIPQSERELVKTHIENNIREIKRILKEIGSFSKQHHPLFRRFKHAGLPVLVGLPFKPPMPDYVKPFEHHLMIHSDPDVLNNMKMIPYNKDVIEGYKILIHTIQRVLQDMITNRIACIQRNVKGIIPLEFHYNLSFYSDDELKRLNVIGKFLEKHPPVNKNLSYNLNANYSKNDIRWYLDLPQFLIDCSRRKDESDVNQKRLDALKLN